MLCTKCGAENNEEDVFCVSCGAVLTGVSLDDYEEKSVEVQAPVQQPSFEHKPSYEQPAYSQQPVYEQPTPNSRPARTSQAVHGTQSHIRRRKKRNPQGVELAPIGAAALAFICLLLPWFKASTALASDSTSLFSAFFSCLGDLGKLNFWYFCALAMYLVLIAAPALVAYFAWRRENNYMGISAAAVLGAFLAWFFTSLATKSGIPSELRSLIKLTPSIGFYLYILCIAAAVGAGVFLSMQRQKAPRRPRTR